MACVLRSGLRELSNPPLPVIGCGCHAIRLVPKHLLPELKKRRAKPAPAAASDESDTSDSGNSSESEPDVDLGHDHVVVSNAAREHQKERFRIQSHIKPHIKLARSITKWCVRVLVLVVCRRVC